MPTPTYTPLANITLGSSAASVTFSSINTSLYRDLVLVITAKGSVAAYNSVQFNSDTGGNYHAVNMRGNGSTTASSSFSGELQFWDGGGSVKLTQTTDGNITTVNIMDYSATDKHKTCLVRGNNSAIASTAEAWRWASTAAVTAVKVFPDGGTYAAGSSFALYGIAA